MTIVFRDRREAGRQLADRLAHYVGRADVTVLALPRGGVPVGFEVARRLRGPLDVFVVRKLGVPGCEEFAMGAIATGGVRVLNDEVVAGLALPADIVDAVTAKEEQELRRREGLYRKGRPPLRVDGRTVILVDDGIATGSTMLAAIRALRDHRPRRIVVAVPVGSPEICEAMRNDADEVVCAMMPELMIGVGRWYADFSQTSDGEVRALLARAVREAAPPDDTAADHAGPRIVRDRSGRGRTDDVAAPMPADQTAPPLVSAGTCPPGGSSSGRRTG